MPVEVPAENRDQRGGLPPFPTMTAVDDDTAQAIRELPVTDADDVRRWVELLRTVYEEVERTRGEVTWPEFTTEVTNAAADFDPTAVETFLRTAEDGSQVELIRFLIEQESDLPSLYETLRASADPVGWVTDEQRAQLANQLGDGWPDILAADLETRWGTDWESHPDEHKTAWLTDLLTTGAFTTTLGWVTEEQQTELTTLWGTDWPETLTTDLETRWGTDWESHPDEHKTAWLTDLIAAGAFAGPAADPESPQAAMAELWTVARDVPGAETLSDEELAEIIADALGQEGPQR
jgi:hypothetical protein